MTSSSLFQKILARSVEPDEATPSRKAISIVRELARFFGDTSVTIQKETLLELQVDEEAESAEQDH
jgi:hypothetical protein